MTDGHRRARAALEKRKTQALALLAAHDFLTVEERNGVGYAVCAGGKVRLDALHALERDRVVIRVRRGFCLAVRQSGETA